jgi:hypothetical protein
VLPVDDALTCDSAAPVNIAPPTFGSVAVRSAARGVLRRKRLCEARC